MTFFASRGRVCKLRLCKLLSVVAFAFLAAAASGEVLNVSHNGLDIGIDERTGSIVSLGSKYTGPGLQAEPTSAGLVDVAYPVDSFAAMRLASRFSRATIKEQDSGLTIVWERLGASRPNLALPEGTVRAEVTIRPANDGRSVIFRCRVRNDSKAPVRQVLFPDLWGLKPFAGVESTRLRLARGVHAPFDEPLKPAESAPFYARPPSSLSWRRFEAGGYYKENSLRWLDFGGLRGGLSMFQRKWGTYDWPNVLTHRTERDPMSLRLVWEHTQAIEPGQSWDSGEFWLTPHAGGWAKGIEAYREYVKQAHPSRTLPRHVAEDIGYQTIWMIQTVEVDPSKAFFRYEDLPRVATDARRYGIHEVVPWGWNVYSTMPIPIRTELGSADTLIESVQQAREIGVNIAPFISISIVRNQYGGRYGVEPSDADWTYHYELVPQFRPYYSDYWNGVEISSNNGVWQKDVLDSLTQWIDRGIGSFSWDVYRVHKPEQQGKPPPLLGLVEEVKSRARARFAVSTFSGESVSHLELDSNQLDYLWNWTDHLAAEPITSVLDAPRVSCNVEDSAMVVAKCFADNLYINAMPRQPDAPNGTALISDEPKLAAALTQANKLRTQFLPFFVDGTFIGDSILSHHSQGFVRAYQLGNRILVVVLNDRNDSGAIAIQSDLDLWLPQASEYQITAYDGSGMSTGTTVLRDSTWFGRTTALDPGQLMLFEVESL